MAAGVYPLILDPVCKRRIWGGRRLQTELGKRLPESVSIGESWEVADLALAGPGEGQSMLTNGPLRGKTLSEVMANWGTGLLGRAQPIDGRFPLLIKFLDAAQLLSVQVHPRADRATANVPAGMKTEAWYVIDAEPGAFIYHGLVPGVDETRLRRALQDGTVERLLRRIEVRKGHCYYLPSGTVHALGAGILVAEVQTPSDVTYRLYDWDRIDPATGRKRELHVEQALASAIYESAPAEQVPQHTASVWASVTSLCRCESFVIERVRMADGVEMQIPYEEMVIWIVLSGEGTIRCEGLEQPTHFRRGDTIILPAAMARGTVATHDNCTWLEVTVPVESSLQAFDRPQREQRLAEGQPATRFVPLHLPDSR